MIIISTRDMPDHANTSLLNYSHLLATPVSVRCCVIVLQAGAPTDSWSSGGIKTSWTLSGGELQCCADAIHENVGSSFQCSVGSTSPGGHFSKVDDFLAPVYLQGE